MNARRWLWLGRVGWFAVCWGVWFAAPVLAQEWRIPVAGNYFRTAPEPGAGRVGRDGTLSWSAVDDVYSVFFYIDQPGRLKLSAELKHNENARWEFAVGQNVFEIEVDRPGTHEYSIGEVEVEQAGYVRVDFRGLKRQGANYGGFVNLVVSSQTKNLEARFVRNNDGNMFYWGRRGPSIHLSYRTPEVGDLEYAYSEITVPQGEDPIGSYFMANGFAEGYFGIQVNSESERRVLFSVWSPFQTDDPQSIPADQRIEALDRGPEVKIGEFGNEGSGGQSFLVYPWEAGKTYRFLTRVVPDQRGNTTYTAWFGDKAAEEWRLIASFRRPKTTTHLRGFHSFLESFDPARGHLHRQSRHHNVWVRNTQGQWHRCVSARFSVDGTGGEKHRVDFGGGVEGDGWYLENCGFFGGQVSPGSVFDLSVEPSDPPILPKD
ncbi:MAG: DUF3472 domain-containing protein [Planctomycetaceae bacterium]|nr:DUF3472 domain-containing protein [Planctomycetaceae bacterium]